MMILCGALSTEHFKQKLPPVETKMIALSAGRIDKQKRGVLLLGT